MTTIKISGIERADIVRLATENGKKLTLTPLGDYQKFIDGIQRTVHCWVVDSISQDRMKFHDVEVWQVGQDWYGECDSPDNEPDDDKACKANRLGGRMCSHLARCLVELELANKIKLSFVGQCDVCSRGKVRVAWDGHEVYRCVDQRTCDAVVAKFHEGLAAKDRKDLFDG